jgi:hypothetical protein
LDCWLQLTIGLYGKRDQPEAALTSERLAHAWLTVRDLNQSTAKTTFKTTLSLKSAAILPAT